MCIHHVWYHPLWYTHSLPLNPLQYTHPHSNPLYTPHILHASRAYELSNPIFSPHSASPPSSTSPHAPTTLPTTHDNDDEALFGEGAWSHQALLRTHRSLDDWDVCYWQSPLQGSARRTAPRMARFGLPETAAGFGMGGGGTGARMTPPMVPPLRLAGLLGHVEEHVEGAHMEEPAGDYNGGVQRMDGTIAATKGAIDDGTLGVVHCQDDDDDAGGPLTARVSASSTSGNDHQQQAAAPAAAVLALDTITAADAEHASDASQGDDIIITVSTTSSLAATHPGALVADNHPPTQPPTHPVGAVADMASALDELKRNIEKLSTCPSLVNSPRAYTHRSMHGHNSSGVPGSPIMYTARSTGFLSARTNSSNDAWGGMAGSAAALAAAAAGDAWATERVVVEDGFEVGGCNHMVGAAAHAVRPVHQQVPQQQLPSSFMAQLLDRSWVEGCEDVDKLKQAVLALQALQLGVAVAVATSPPHMVRIGLLLCVEGLSIVLVLFNNLLLYSCTRVCKPFLPNAHTTHTHTHTGTQHTVAYW